jgi:hypothetical protein
MTPDSSAGLLLIADAAFQGSYHGLLLHGSQALGHADENSDIDLVYVVPGGGKHQYACCVNGSHVDVYAATEASLLFSIEEDKPDNNNFLLRAFSHGQSLKDESGSLERLMLRARSIWQRGPVSSSYSERKSLISAIDKSSAAVRRLCARAELSDSGTEHAGLVAVQCAMLFFRLTYAYCRMRRLWASSIQEMLSWPDEPYAKLQQFCHAYLKAKSLREKMAVLDEFAIEVAEPVPRQN